MFRLQEFQACTGLPCRVPFFEFRFENLRTTPRVQTLMKDVLPKLDPAAETWLKRYLNPTPGSLPVHVCFTFSEPERKQFCRKAAFSGIAVHGQSGPRPLPMWGVALGCRDPFELNTFVAPES